MKLHRYSLQKDDVLFTEGGHFDKLEVLSGKETSPTMCIKKIFVFRVDSADVLPYRSWLKPYSV